MAPNSQGITRFEPIRRGGYVAEILASSWRDGAIFHYVVQRQDSKEILHFGQELSEQRAREIVDEILTELNRKASSQSA